MYKVVFVFVIGVVTGYFVAGLADSEIAGTPMNDEEENIVSERESDDDSQSVREEVSDPTIKNVIDESIGIRFQYRSEPDGYVVRSLPKTATDDAAFVKGYQLMLATDAEFMATAQATEGPPTIEVRVFKNIDRLAPSVWVDANPLLSNIELIRADRVEEVVGGANAVRYTVDGLYLIDTVAVAHAQMIYLITGAYATNDDFTRIDFEPFLDSIEFVPVR